MTPRPVASRAIQLGRQHSHQVLSEVVGHDKSIQQLNTIVSEQYCQQLYAIVSEQYCQQLYAMWSDGWIGHTASLDLQLCYLWTIAWKSPIKQVPASSRH